MGEDEFLYHDRLIHFGKARDGERWLYRYEDTQMRVDEERNLAKMVKGRDFEQTGEAGQDGPGRAHPHRLRPGPRFRGHLPAVQAEGQGREAVRNVEGDAAHRQDVAAGRCQRLRAGAGRVLEGLCHKKRGEDAGVRGAEEGQGARSKAGVRLIP